MRAVENPDHCAALETEKRCLEDTLRAEAVESVHGGTDTERVARAYADYYRAHDKTYHVRAQWESVARKGKAIPSRAALVEAMFMAELKNLILTAGHDLDAIVPPVQVGVTAAGHRYVLLNGTERVLEAGDMMMADGMGIVSSVLRGPDERTRITPDTRNVLFAVYAPAGIGEDGVRSHLEDIRENVLLVAPAAQTVELTAMTAG